MEKAEKAIIQLTLVYKAEETRIHTFPNQYLSLMTLISDHLPINGFGLCSGMGSCGTCLIHIQRKQMSFRTSWLACRVAITDDLTSTQIIIPDKIF